MHKAGRELQVHLDLLDIDCEFNEHDGSVTILAPTRMLEHLTGEEFICRPASENSSTASPSIPVPTHRTDNPIGALQEWCTRSKKAPPVYAQSENIGTVREPKFECSIQCDGTLTRAKAANKATSKREAVLSMMTILAARYGKERP